MSPAPIIVNNSKAIKVMGLSWSVIDRCDICSNNSIMADNIIKSLEFQLDIVLYMSISKVSDSKQLVVTDLSL